MPSIYQPDIENRFPLNTVTITTEGSRTVCTVTVTAGGALVVRSKSLDEGSAVLKARRALGIRDSAPIRMTTAQRVAETNVLGLDVFDITLGTEFYSTATAWVPGRDATVTFPSSPVNNDVFVANGEGHQFNSAEKSWYRAEGNGLFVDQNSNEIALNVDSEATTVDIISVQANTLTTGVALNLFNANALTTGRLISATSNSADTSGRALVNINNQNPLATGAIPLSVANSSSGTTVLVSQGLGVVDVTLLNTRVDLGDFEESHAITFQAGASNNIAKIAAFTEGTGETLGGLALYGFDGAFNRGVHILRSGEARLGVNSTLRVTATAVGVGAAPLTGSPLDVVISTPGVGASSGYAAQLVNTNATANAVVGIGLRVVDDIRAFFQGENSGAGEGRMHLGVRVGDTLTRVITIDGLTTTLFGPVSFDDQATLSSFTVATVPSASSPGAGSMIFVTDETGGAVPAFSDGTNWRRVTDRAVIA